MDMKDSKERYVSEGEQLEIEEIFVAANRQNINSENNEFHSSPYNESPNNNQNKFGRDETDFVNNEAQRDIYSSQKTEVTDGKQPNLTDELPKQWKYFDEAGIQEQNRFQQNAGPQQHFGYQQHYSFEQNTGFQQQLNNPNNYHQNYNRDGVRNQDLNLMTDGVFIVQHNSQRMEVPYNQLNPTGRYQEEWEFPAKYKQEDNILAKDNGRVSTNNYDNSRDLGYRSQQNSQIFYYSQDDNQNSTKKLLEQWKSSQKPEVIKHVSLKVDGNVSMNHDVLDNDNLTTSDQPNSTEVLLHKWKTSDKSRKEDQLLAKDIENVLKKHEKIISRDRDEKFTLEMEFSPKDVPFNIRVEPAKELKGFTASLEEVSTGSISQYSQTYDDKNKKLQSERNRYRQAENLLNVGIEVVPLAVDQNFSADVDKSVFREECVRRILKDDHKTKQPVEPIAVLKSGSKNQFRPPIFLRDSPSKNVDEFKEDTKENVFERDFVRTKPNDVLQSWVQMMEGFLEDQKVKLRRKMYQEDVLRDNDYDYDRRFKSNDFDRSGFYEPTWIEEGITETNRMISRTQLYSNSIPQEQPRKSKGAALKREEVEKKQGIMKSAKKKESGAAQKSQAGKNKAAKKGKRKVVERAGPPVYKSKGPVFKPPSLNVGKEKKSFIKDVESPIKRSLHGFGLIRKILT